VLELQTVASEQQVGSEALFNEIRDLRLDRIRNFIVLISSNFYFRISNALRNSQGEFRGEVA
jgi:hypothetical protein